jgi:hypothetical protein
MKSQAPKAMVEPFDTNPVTKLWVTINNNVLLTQQLNEYLKLVKIAMVSMLGFVKDERIFSMLAFMKDKFRSMLGLHLDTIICMFAQELSFAACWVYIWTQLSACLHKSFIFKKAFLIKRLLQLGKIKKFRLVLPLSKFYSFHITKFNCSCFHDLDKSSDCAGDCAWFFMKFINIWVWWVGL